MLLCPPGMWLAWLFPSHWQSHPASAPDVDTGGSDSPGMETGAGTFPVEVTSSAWGGRAGLGHREQMSAPQRPHYSERPGAPGAAPFPHGNTAVPRGQSSADPSGKGFQSREPCAQQGGGSVAPGGGLQRLRGPRGSHTVPLQPPLWAQCTQNPRPVPTAFADHS